MSRKRAGPTLFHVFIAGVVAASAMRHAGASDARSRGQVVFTQIPVAVRSETQDRFDSSGDKTRMPLGARIVLLDASAPERGVKNLTPDFASAGKPDVSFDGSRILFIGKRTPTDRSSIWEMAADGTELREVIRFPTDCVEVVHLSSIYTMDADQPYRQMAFVARAPAEGVMSIFTCRMDGSAIHRITFAPEGASDPCPLSDGRLLFRMGSESESGVERNADSRGAALFTVNVDGTDLFPFAGFEPASKTDLGEPCETSSGLVVYVEAKPGPQGGDRLAAVSRTESLHSRSVIADQEGASFRAPSAVADGKILASYRSAEAESYGIFIVDPKADPPRTLLFDDPMWDDRDPVTLGPRREPAGRSSVVQYTRQVGQLYCLNAYLSDHGRESQAHPGSIRGVRVWRFGDQPPSNPTSLPSNPTPPTAERPPKESKTLLGDFQVESDGSFYLEVPAGIPLRLETLDDSGHVLQGMRTWMWVMPGERRGCIGCHEDRELAPPNRHVLALRRRPQGVGNGATIPAAVPTSPEQSGGGTP